MLKIKEIKIFLPLVTFSFFYIAGSSQSLDLRDAINIALKNSLEVELLKNNVEINNTNNYIGVAGGLPVVSANATDNEQLNNINQKLNTGTEIKRNGATGNTFNAGLTAGMLLYNGSRVVAAKKRLEQLQLQSEQYLNSQIQNTMAAVMTAYYDIVRQQYYIRTIDVSIEVSQKRLEIVKTQQSVGMANNADLYQSQLDLNALMQTKQSQQLVIDQSKTELLLLLNLKPDSTITISDTITMDKAIILGDVLEKLSNNADIIAADDQVKISDLIIRETAAQRYPSIRANAAYNYNRNQSTGGQLLLNQNNGASGGLSIAIPIYNGAIFKRQQKVAELNSKNAAIQKDILIRNYASGAVKTYQAYVNNLQQLETQKQTVELSQKLLDLVLQRFQLKQATIVDVRQAQQTFEAASYTLTNLNFAAKSSEIELNRLVNQIKF
ncbi:MAG: TolC family protein [Chitinophagaceae bacterium]|nr:TolC family protein [Chitinophagaceae bacterium]